MNNNLKVGDKVHTFLTWSYKKIHNVKCVIGEVPNGETRLYRLDSPQFLNGYLYRAEDEFTPIK